MWRKFKMILEKVTEILVEQLDVDADIVKATSSIQDDLGADSLDLADIVMSIEEEFDVEVPDDALASIKTVGDVVKYVEENAE